MLTRLWIQQTFCNHQRLLVCASLYSRVLLFLFACQNHQPGRLRYCDPRATHPVSRVHCFEAEMNVPVMFHRCYIYDKRANRTQESNYVQRHKSQMRDRHLTT